jgi:hypothetical protein
MSTPSPSLAGPGEASGDTAAEVEAARGAAVMSHAMVAASRISPPALIDGLRPELTWPDRPDPLGVGTRAGSALRT